MSEVKVTIRLRTFLYAALVLIGLILAWELRTIIVMLFLAFILNAGLRPLVENLVTRNLPRSAAIALIYFGIFAFLVVVAIIMANEFVNQLINLVNAIPSVFATIAGFLENNVPALANVLPLTQLQTEVGQFADEVINSSFVRDLLTGENILSVVSQTFGIFGSVAELLVGLFTIVMVSIYMLQRKGNFYDDALALLPKETAENISGVLKKIETSLGAWLSGQLTLMFIVGLITYFIIWIPGLIDPTYRLDDFALPIALLAGILEALPNVGPAITLVISAILAIGTSGPLSVVYIAIAFTLLQNIEGVFLVPMVMKRAVGIDPILSILGIIGAFQLFGVLGALLVIPFLGILQIILVEIANEYKRIRSMNPKLVE